MGGKISTITEVNNSIDLINKAIHYGALEKSEFFEPIIDNLQSALTYLLLAKELIKEGEK